MRLPARAGRRVTGVVTLSLLTLGLFGFGLIRLLDLALAGYGCCAPHGDGVAGAGQFGV